MKIPRGLLCRVLCKGHSNPPHAHLRLRAQVFTKPTKEDEIMLDLLNTQGVLLTIAPKTDSGKPAPVDGVPRWTTTTPDTVSFEASNDGMSCTVLTLDDAVGPWEVVVEADADIGAGVTTITATIGGNVSHPQATNLGLTPGVPFEKP